MKNSSGLWEGTICEDVMRFKPTAVTLSNFGVGAVLSIGAPLMYAKEIERFTANFKAGNEYELKQIRKKRSLDANAYFWVLADEIAKVVNTTKEQVYWHLVRRVGVFETLKFDSEAAMNRFKRNWRSNGLGWLTLTIDKENFVIQAFYGSSRYDTKEMSRLIDEAISEAKSLGIEVRPREEIDSMLKEWSESSGR